MKRQPDKIKALREEIEATVRLYGLTEAENMLGIVVLGVCSRVWDKEVVVEVGIDGARKRP